MSVLLDPNNQLDLSARKFLAARLLRLTRTAKLERQLAMEGAEEIEIDLGVNSGLLDKLSSLVDDQINEQYYRDERIEETTSLIGFLDAMHEKFADACAYVGVTAETNTYLEVGIGASLQNDIDHFNCEKCGRAGLYCNNGLVDREMLADPEGGLCLSFLKKLIETFTIAAESCYADVLGEKSVANLIPPIVLETYRKNGSHGTLPIDGEFEQPGAEPSATMRIYWPIDETLDAAIRSLPYLVFHEVFVHGTQGAALAEPRFRVDDSCAFTEGAVDAVACDLLLERVLTMPEALPALLEALYTELEQASREYHNKRSQKETLTTARLLAPETKIRQARYLGRQHVYSRLKRVREEAKRDADWPQRVILMLNLHLDKAQRRQIFRLFNRLGSSRLLRLSLADKFDLFLKTADVDALLDDLTALIG